MRGHVQDIRFGKTLWLVLFLLSTELLPAQDKKISQVQFLAGPGYLRNNAILLSKSRQPKFGYTAGIGLNYSFSRKFQLELGLSAQEKGFRTKTPNIDVDNINQTLEINRSIDYLTFSAVPSVLLGKKNSFSIGAGPYYSILLLVRTEMTRKGEDGEIFFHRRSRHRSNAINDVGLSLHAGYVIWNGEKHQVGIRAVHQAGFVNYTETFGGPIKSNSTFLVVSYTFKR